MDKMLGEVANKKNHLKLIKKSNELTKELEQLDHRRDEITKDLAEIDAEFVYNDFSFHQVSVIHLKCWISKSDCICTFLFMNEIYTSPLSFLSRLNDAHVEFHSFN